MFYPYIKPLGIGSLDFFFANEEAQAWYDPLKPYTKLEYEWVLENVDFTLATVLDIGCHHGNYALVLADTKAIKLIAVDAHPSNCMITEANLAINHIGNANILYCAATPEDGPVHFSGESNGYIVGSGGVIVKGKKLSSIEPLAEIIKIDIEGGEFPLFPAAIDEMKCAHTWIIEVHPNAGNPDDIACAFDERGFELLKVDRERLVVRPYQIGEKWLTHATLISRKELE